MKKTLVALATLFAIGCAFADVDVSGGIKLYGVLDQAYMNQKWQSSAATVVTNSNTGMFAAGATSRLGVRGARDLENNMRAFIQTEIELWPDCSSDCGGVIAAKNRGTFVGLENKGIGDIRLGTQETTAYELFAMDANGRVEYKPQVWRYTASSSTLDRAGNAIKLTTAEFKGFTATAMYAPGEQGSGVASKTNFSSIGIKFNEGNLKAAFVYDSITNTAGSYRMPGLVYEGLSKYSNSGSTGPAQGSALTYAAANGKDSHVRNIAAVSYNINNMATLNYIYAKSQISSSGSLDTNTFGVKIPMDKFTAALSMGVGSYSNSTKTAYGNVADTTYGLTYAFDKSTSVYALSSKMTHTYLTYQQGHTKATAFGLQYKF